MQYEICVELKKEVLDTQGRAIKNSLDRVGFDGLQDVRVTKRYLIDIDKANPDPETTIHKIAKEYLANPVSEKYTVKIVN